MPNVCMYFEVHQPQRLRSISRFDTSSNTNLFDDAANDTIMNKVAKKCYLPANQVLLDLINKHEGDFKVAFSITGTALEQMERFAPEVLWSFQDLAKTGCVEFLGETYYHSLSALYDENEFREQVEKHSKAIELYFGQTPKVFRNTELIYENRIGELVKDLGFKAVLAEGADDILDWRSPNYMYQHPHNGLPLLLKNYRLSDDVAFRFSNQGWEDFPLTADKFANWVHKVNGNGEVVNLFMDYETFGEHQWEDTGIFNFLEAMPEKIMGDKEWSFKTPSEIVQTIKPVTSLSFDRFVSWADMERDISAWSGNKMQRESLQSIFSLGREIKARNNPAALDLWRHLQTSDHFYYMCTKWCSDGDVHAYFSPYESPYEAFMNYMNALRCVEDGVLNKANILQKEISQLGYKEMQSV
jgi:alpha-amylase